MNQAFQQLAPVLQTYAQTTGDMTPLNNLIQDVAKSMDLDPARYQMRSMTLPTQQQLQLGEPEQDVPGHQSQATTNIPAPG